MKTTKFLSACLLLLPFMSCTQVSDTKDKAVENKVDKLLSKMTLEEKIGQMNQISSFGNIEEMSVLIKKGEIGSILNEIDPVRVNALQSVAVEESRLGIPLLIAVMLFMGLRLFFLSLWGRLPLLILLWQKKVRVWQLLRHPLWEFAGRLPR